VRRGEQCAREHRRPQPRHAYAGPG
jgi:hypothetical protein